MRGRPFARADEVDTMSLSQEFAQSLVDNRVRSIAAGKRYVWVGTERGVSRHDLRRRTGKLSHRTRTTR